MKYKLEQLWRAGWKVGTPVNQPVCISCPLACQFTVYRCIFVVCAALRLLISQASSRSYKIEGN